MGNNGEVVREKWGEGVGVGDGKVKEVWEWGCEGIRGWVEIWLVCVCGGEDGGDLRWEGGVLWNDCVDVLFFFVDSLDFILD